MISKGWDIAQDGWSDLRIEENSYDEVSMDIIQCCSNGENKRTIYIDKSGAKDLITVLSEHYGITCLS